jgi:hypothetical protein
VFGGTTHFPTVKKNPNSSGGRNQEDRGPKPTWAYSSQKKSITKKPGGVVQGVGPEFKPKKSQNIICLYLYHR